MISAVSRYTRADTARPGLGLLGLSIPNFWLATMMILVVSMFARGVLPTSGYVPFEPGPARQPPLDAAAAVALAVANMAILMRMTRSSMLEVLRQEYVTTARAKGLIERTWCYRHALRNALIPVVTIAGVQVGYLLGGAIIDRADLRAAGRRHADPERRSCQRDYPVVQGGGAVRRAEFVLVNLAGGPPVRLSRPEDPLWLIAARIGAERRP